MSIEAMKQALEALENTLGFTGSREIDSATRQAITSLRQAIAEAEKQEPYGYLKLSNGKFYHEVEGVPDLACNPDYLPLHTHPQPKREPPTPREVKDVLRATGLLTNSQAWDAAEEVMKLLAAHGIKENT